MLSLRAKDGRKCVASVDKLAIWFKSVSKDYSHLSTQSHISILGLDSFSRSPESACRLSVSRVLSEMWVLTFIPFTSMCC